MPVDVSGKEKGKRAALRVATPHDDRQRELDITRRRDSGEIACAECTRLKLRCDKKAPCSSCTRRGCATICPNSVLASGHGSSIVLSDIEQLHCKLLAMSERIRQLENALAVETARLPDLHPLLQEELLVIKQGIPTLGASPPLGQLDNTQESDCFDDFGTLTIADDGIARFIGRTGGAESLLMADLDVQESDIGLESAAETESSQAEATSSNGLYNPHVIDQARVVGIINDLPSYERGWTLCETYLQQSSWFTRMVQRDQLIDELLTPIYDYKNKPEDEREELDPVNPHELALLLAIFSMGALADLTLQQFSEEADQYYQIARSIVNLEVAADAPSLTVVQALTVMATYCTLSDRMVTIERALSTLNFASVLGIAIGLHRDPRMWDLDEKIAERRRHLFWQLFTLQNWQGLASGRPAMFTLNTSDCGFPKDNEDTQLDESGQPEVGYWRWRYAVARDVLDPINNLTCSVGPVKYADILELDRKVRETKIPRHLQIPAGGSDWETDGPFKVMSRLVPVIWCDTMCLYIHRSYFAKALLDFPENPLRSQYAASFLSAYRSSLSLLKLSREHYALCPDFMARSWMLWKHVFSALVIVGTIVIRGPNSSLAPASLVELTIGIGFFEKSAKDAHWSRRALAVLRRLRDKAVNVYSQYWSGNMEVVKGIASRVKREDIWVDELALFGSQSRIAKRPRSKRKAAHTPRQAAARNPIEVDMSEMSAFVTLPVASQVPEQGGVLPSHQGYLTTSTSSTPSPPSYGPSPSFSAPLSDFVNMLAAPAEPPPDHDGQPFSSTEPLMQMDFSGMGMDRVPSDDASTYASLPFACSSSSNDVASGLAPWSGGLDPSFVGMDEAWSSFLQDSGLLVGSPSVHGPSS